MIDTKLAPETTAIALEVDDGIATITLDRPDHRNAWTIAMTWDLDRTLRWCEAQDEIRAVVVTGRGPSFCVGADLASGNLLRPGSEELEPPEDTFLPSRMSKPVIAAMNGSAAGAGVTFALHCDFRVVAETAKVALPFVRRGVVPELEANWILPRLVGLGTALDLLLRGRTITGAEAERIGLCHEAVPAETVLARATELAREITTNGAPLALAFTKRLLWSDAGRADLLMAENAAFVQCAMHPDAREGVTSFLERREPAWTGSVSEIADQRDGWSA